ncbi:MAG: dienelactone hydrolase family protein [Burkholderiaceae bacterium]|nr:dienelactone hydrolase family protein [Burkholderiaceae bacterium]
MSTLIHSQWVPLGSNGGDGFDGFLVRPPAGRGPGLLLWQEIFGVNAHIRRVAEQYALAGFTVLAPDVFWRRERRVELGYGEDGMARGRALMGAITPDALRADVEAAATALRALPEVTGDRLGAVGYCFGGRLAYFSAAWAGVDAAVCYYGGGIHDQLALAPAIRGDLLFHYAEHDNHIPLAAVDRVRSATCTTDRPGNACHVYPGTQHGFNCWERGSYHAGASALALGRSLQFLAERLF